MKANELFPGALARVNRDGLCIKKDTIVEVRAVDADDKLIEKGLIGSAHCHPLDDNQFEGWIWCEYLDPIPITPEILERNGFVWDAYHKQLQLVCDSIHIGWGFYPECLSVSDWEDDGKNQISSLYCKYVHELQHCLKLVGIDKEIIL